MTAHQHPETAYSTPYYTPQQPRINAWWVRIPVLLLGGSLLTGLVLAIFFVALQVRYADIIYPNVYVLGTNLGGKTPDEARTLLVGNFSYGDKTVFTFRDGDKFWQMTANELGVSFDLDETINRAFAIGHSGSLVSDVFGQASAWFRSETVSPVITYNQQTAVNKLTEIASSINQEPQNASLSLNGAEVTTSQGRNGRTLDIMTTLSRLEARLLAMQSGAEIPLVINETPPIVYSVDEPASLIRTALSGDVQLVATDERGNALGPWRASRDQIAALLRVDILNNSDGTQSYDVGISMSAFESFLSTLAPGLLASAQNGRFRFNEQTQQLEVIQPAVSGRTLNVPETLKRLEEAVFSSNRIAPMAFDLTLPTYHNQITAAELGITELVSDCLLYTSDAADE